MIIAALAVALAAAPPCESSSPVLADFKTALVIIKTVKVANASGTMTDEEIERAGAAYKSFADWVATTTCGMAKVSTEIAVSEVPLLDASKNPEGKLKGRAL